MTDEQRSADEPRGVLGATRIDAVRAAVVVACFVVALALLLGPASNLVASSSTTSTTQHHQLPPVHKNRVTVQVANGTSITGLANSWTQPLLTEGWAALPAASTTGFHPTHTWIFFKAGQQQAAKLLAAELHVRHTYVTLLTHQAIAAVQGAASDDVVVVIGLHHHGEGIAAS